MGPFRVFVPLILGKNRIIDASLLMHVSHWYGYRFPILFLFMRVIYFTDIHLHQGHDSVAGFEKALEEMLALQPQLLICGGDQGVEPICRQVYSEIVQPVPVPILFCPGNHEIDNGFFENGRHPGSASISHDAGAAHIIVLDALREVPADAGRNYNWWGLADEAQLVWLTAALETVSLDKPLLFVTHIPLKSSVVQRLTAGVIDAEYPYTTIRNSEVILQQLGQRGSVACLAGHFHENEQFQLGNLQILTTGAIAGNWWRGGWNSPNIDGSPQGFRVLDIDDGKIASRYIAFDPAQRHEAALYRRGDGSLYVNVFDASSTTQVRFSGESLEFLDPYLPPYDHRPGHLWRMPNEFTDSTAEVEILFEDGRVLTEQVSETAVPAH